MFNMERIVISGATGAIGVALIHYGLEKQMQILAICHKDSRRIKRLPKVENIHILELSAEEYSDFVNNKRQEIESLGAYDCFFHLAWQGTTGTDRNDMNLQLRNVRYTLDAIELAAAFGCKCFVGAGSQAEYGRVEGILSSATPTFPENGYGIAKLCAGQMSRIRCEQLHIKHIWTRILSVYGPGDDERTLIMSAIKGFLNREHTEFSAGMQKWDYIYSMDAARALIGLAVWGKDGHVYCIGSGKTQLLKEYIHQVYAVINAQDTSDEKIGIGKRPYMDKQVMYLQADTREWPKELQKEFDKKPMCSFNEGIHHTINWIKHIREEEK